MGRPRKKIHDYRVLAEQHQLVFLDPIAPGNVNDPCNWQCKLCDRKMTKSYHSLQHYAHPCRCRSETIKMADEYRVLAEQLGIEWVGTKQPQSSKKPTKWRGKTGEVVNASFFQLAHNLSRAMSIRLGLSHEEER